MQANRAQSGSIPKWIYGAVLGCALLGFLWDSCNSSKTSLKEVWSGKGNDYHGSFLDENASSKKTKHTVNIYIYGKVKTVELGKVYTIPINSSKPVTPSIELKRSCYWIDWNPPADCDKAILVENKVGKRDRISCGDDDANLGNTTANRGLYFWNEAGTNEPHIEVLVNYSGC